MNFVPVSGSVGSAVLGLAAPVALALGLVVAGLLVSTAVVLGVAAYRNRRAASARATRGPSIVVRRAHPSAA